MLNPQTSELELESAAFREYISRFLGVPLTSLVDVTHWTRLYSTGWTLCVDDGRCRQRYFVKRLGSPAAAHRQAKLTQRADALFSADPHYVPLNARQIPDSDIIVTQDVRLPCLNETLLLSSQPRPYRWYRDASQAIALAGRWLRQFHASHATTGSPVPALRRYAENRKDILSRLQDNLYQDLTEVLDMCPDGNITVTHSDFNGWNILTDGNRLSVIDHGICEWLEMSPAWDVASFIASFHVFARETMLTPVHWVRPLKTRFAKIFLDAYGDSAIASSGTFATCVALRHALSYLQLNAEYASRAPWHLCKLRWWLAEAHKRLQHPAEQRVVN